MKNSEKALILAKYINHIVANDYVVNVKAFAEREGIDINTLFSLVTEGNNVLVNEYLDYVNNYLTVEKFAEHRQMSELEADMLIMVGRKVFNKEY